MLQCTLLSNNKVTRRNKVFIPTPLTIQIGNSTVKKPLASVQHLHCVLSSSGKKGPRSKKFLLLQSSRGKMAKLSSYEARRQQRLEENRKRMEALNLPKLSQALQTNSSPKPSPVKNIKPRTIEKQVVVVRRSSRVANKPAPDYKEAAYDRVEITTRRIYYKRRDLSNRVYASTEARAEAIEKAEKLESELEPEYPSFVKPMLQSHVTGGFWLGLPSHFCSKNLPKRDEPIDLIDENGDKHQTLYLARKNGLSAGWRGFAIAHELVDGDALVFQLIRSTAFKVYIIRVNDSEKA